MNSPCDVLVAGGGVAGLPAAVAASRAGARTVLIERESFLGGSGVTALHRYLCGLYLNGTDEPKETLNTGLTREIVTRLRALSPSSHPLLLMGRAWGLPFEPNHLRAVYERLAEWESNLTLITSSTVETVQCSGNRITDVTVRTAESEEHITPRAVIDATGSGAVIRLAGAPFQTTPESECQPGACTLHLEGIEGDRQLLAIKIAWQLGRLPLLERSGLPPFAGFAAGCSEHEGFCKFSIPPELARMGEEAIQQRLARVHALLAERLPELRESRITGRTRVMERENIRMEGEWELDEDAILHGRKFPSGVVRNAWPIEFWEPGHPSPLYTYPPDGDYYEIPRRCLRSRTITNLFAAGRCISASSKALASTRPMGTCIALGEAAGKLAAIYR